MSSTAYDSRRNSGFQASSTTTGCLDHQAAPLLRSTFSDEIGCELFPVTAELSRLAGFVAA
ncbi:hypothetical protein [Streptomyces sp. NBC_00576]|uniref:hypothetical protein n=1 Tax=Streptomyces sp. NBC_00576 TaxID=2903665 RepID=UPI002E81B99A|nr:hypothetical protein [Streptomyces sp. NBC_00576]WUB73500.1 hypothetical protein OG734_27380 [Streptomyces sp. NBC_00576]